MKTQTKEQFKSWNAECHTMRDDQGEIPYSVSVRKNDDGRFLGIVGEDRILPINRHLISNLEEVQKNWGVKKSEPEVLLTQDFTRFFIQINGKQFNYRTTWQTKLVLSGSYDNSKKQVLSLWVEPNKLLPVSMPVTELTFAKFCKNHGGNWEDRNKFMEQTLQGVFTGFKSLFEKTADQENLKKFIDLIIASDGNKAVGLKKRWLESSPKIESAFDILKSYLIYIKQVKIVKGSFYQREETKHLEVAELDFKKLIRKIIECC